MASGPLELRIVLVGKTGAGKSATGNSILGRKEFTSKPSSNAVTSECTDKSCVWNGLKIVLVDTPGLFDPVVPNAVIAQEITKSIVKSVPGPHAFVLVIQASRFTPEEANAVKDIQTLFGDKAAGFMLLLFTRMDDLEEDGVTLEEFIESGDEKLQGVVMGCDGRYLGFNNRAKGTEREQQVKALISMVQGMVDINGGSYYTNESFQKAEEKIRVAEMEIRQERERNGQTNQELPPPREEAKKSVLKRALEALLSMKFAMGKLSAVATVLRRIFQ